MAYKITEECSVCGACEPECPNGAISTGDDISVIDPAKCTECVGFHNTPQCSEVCPTEAVQLDSAHKESKEQLLEKFKKLHPGKSPK